MRTIASWVSKRNSASARASSVLPTPVGPRKRNEPIGRLGSARPARERRIAPATASIASSWPIDALVQAVLHVNQLLDLGLEQARQRDAGPARDDLRDVVGVDLLLEEDGLGSARLARVLRARARARGSCRSEARRRAQSRRHARRARPRCAPARAPSCVRDLAITSFSACHCAFIVAERSRCSASSARAPRDAARKPHRSPWPATSARSPAG